MGSVEYTVPLNKFLVREAPQVKTLTELEILLFYHCGSRFQEPIFVFVLEVSYYAVKSGMLKVSRLSA